MSRRSQKKPAQPALPEKSPAKERPRIVLDEAQVFFVRAAHQSLLIAQAELKRRVDTILAKNGVPAEERYDIDLDAKWNPVALVWIPPAGPVPSPQQKDPKK